MNFYIVMQGQTYIEEKENNIIWSKQVDKSGMHPHFWERMKEVKAGDCIFHYVKGDIVAVSIAKKDCYEAENPYDALYKKVGNKVETSYEELNTPLNIKDNFQEIELFLPIKYSAFQENGDGNQGYLYPCNEQLAIKLLELIADNNVNLEKQEQLEFAISSILLKEPNRLLQIIAVMESEAKVKIRKGLQKFKQTLSPIWDNQCAICNIDSPELLHPCPSKPWKDSTEEERLDPYNGILLCYNHEALYEKGYIAFDGQGKIHISARIEERDYDKYRIHSKMRINRKEENKKYFKWHKKNVLK
ncbi:HNH endonuclease [Psychrobacillus sp. FSL K6-2684]|uniref:HNH endonuclease n=1 Tax=Psychrobacillus faecigallinarum TaxID=2762235 RepID=A0ABR8R799_9BACI|nr:MULTISPECIES: HNH endonuclease [Psychrobacillus]MBD7943674.1 HNH endonuclease [Psychrobacillus faecigallinarum]QEY22821.1 HNH endonuclease [Psychrobacillus sp. AK 1817]QGM29690.1 HNH endonuclease [Bacillus sp. N3536]